MAKPIQYCKVISLQLKSINYILKDKAECVKKKKEYYKAGESLLGLRLSVANQKLPSLFLFYLVHNTEGGTGPDNCN